MSKISDAFGDFGFGAALSLSVCTAFFLLVNTWAVINGSEGDEAIDSTKYWIKLILLNLTMLAGFQLLHRSIVALNSNGWAPPTEEEILNGSEKVSSHGEFAIGLFLMIAYAALLFITLYV